MEFFELKLIEKIGQVFSIAMHDRKYNRLTRHYVRRRNLIF